MRNASIRWFLVFLITGGVWCGFAQAAEINCDIQTGACTIALGTAEVTLDIEPRPVKAMQDLVFRVTVSGAFPPSPPVIHLGMPGMEMGPNRVDLKPISDGIFEGRGVIVRCPSGRTVWRARVDVPGAGGVDFIFDVIY